jgi:hypothetical protein
MPGDNQPSNDYSQELQSEGIIHFRGNYHFSAPNSQNEIVKFSLNFNKAVFVQITLHLS